MTKNQRFGRPPWLSGFVRDSNLQHNISVRFFRFIFELCGVNGRKQNKKRPVLAHLKLHLKNELFAAETDFKNGKI